MNTQVRPVVASFGMGVDSVAYAMEWITNPDSRDFDLRRDLVCVTAMTGDEYERTEDVMNRLVLPAFASEGIRYVMLSRASQSGGVAVLSDSRATRRMVMKGPWSLADEMATAGTIPQLASKARRCSSRAKAEPIEAWIKAEFGDRPRRHIMGYAADEPGRALVDQRYATILRCPEYPLIEWNWVRERAAQFLLDLFGEEVPRSCCRYCCFSGASKAGRAELVGRWAIEPAAGAMAVAMEYTALALNENQRLYGDTSARKLAVANGMGDVLELADARIAAARHGLYEVRRITFARAGDPSGKGPVWRSTRQLTYGSRARMTRELHRRAERSRMTVEVDDDGFTRAELIPRGNGPYPSIEYGLAVAPATVQDKQLKNFDKHWARLSAQHGPTLAGAGAAVRGA